MQRKQKTSPSKNNRVSPIEPKKTFQTTTVQTPAPAISMPAAPVITMPEKPEKSGGSSLATKLEAEDSPVTGGCDCLPSFPKLKLGINPSGIFMLWLLTTPASGASIKPKNAVEDINWKENYGFQSEHGFMHQPLFQELSQTPFETFNKPTDMEMGGKDGKVVPISCVTGSSENCATDMEAFQKYVNPKSFELKQSREASDALEKQIAGEIMPEAQAITKGLNPTEREIFKGLVKKLPKLIKVFSSVTSANSKELNGGNCDEATAQDIFTILKDKVENGNDVKIQIVSLGKSRSKEKIREHVYLQLDNPSDDTIINEDPISVKNELANMGGSRLDRWNNGHFSSPANDHSFYRGDAGWNVMSRKTLDINFSQLASLPEDAQNFICDQFTRIGLDLSGGICKSQKKGARKFKKKN